MDQQIQPKMMKHKWKLYFMIMKQNVYPSGKEMVAKYWSIIHVFTKEKAIARKLFYRYLQHATAEVNQNWIF